MPPRKTNKRSEEEVAVEGTGENDASPPKRAKGRKAITEKSDDAREPRFPRAAKNKKPEVTPEPEPVKKSKASTKKNDATSKKAKKAAKSDDEDEPLNDEDNAESDEVPEVPKKKARGKPAAKKAGADEGKHPYFISIFGIPPKTKCRL